ncbi:MAG: arginine--tRNA ligase [Chloroflexota bacterium]|nr:arginine--tRNA ligase [Chloroflexota bacterium]MED5410670.1 arginine--tRNA ligase [Chloroflexota bacterium]MED5449690.1 arginine--tRNA ligase [Chloroflexota bacterium]MEE3345655.1 arginine--tRNA ligase [Chloroflexota bacterium]
MTTVPEMLSDSIKKAFDLAQKDNLIANVEIGDTAVERPQNPGHGDYASSLPLKLAKPLKKNPMEIANVLAEYLKKDEILDDVVVANPGFLNFVLSSRWLQNQVDQILSNPESYGVTSAGKDKKFQIEYISANPTGRLHVAHARGAVIGSTLASVLKAAGSDVEQEYYLNDAGAQIDKFHRSLTARYLQSLGNNVDMPEDSYPGEDVIAIAEKIRDSGNRVYDTSNPEEILDLGRVGIALMIEGIKEDIESLKINFDSWFSEQSLFENGQFEKCMTVLTEMGYVYEKDGATWLLNTKLGEEKDNVLIRSNGTPTYFSTDIAYHYNKFVQRKFDKVIDVWGADHQGQVPRLKSAMKMLGSDPDNLEMILVQMVRFKKGETTEKLSKREGNVVPLIELVNEIGSDACRFMFLSRSHESQLDFDLDLAKQQSSENPVYYIQYGHARICSILGLAAEKNIDYSTGSVTMLDHESERHLINKILELPSVINTIADTYEVHHLPHYSLELATSFHNFYQNCRVLSENAADLELSKARLKLCEAAKLSLAYCLDLMGMNKPEKM